MSSDLAFEYSSQSCCLRGSKKLKPGALSLGVISVSRLFDDGFINRFDEKNVIPVSKNNLVYFMAVPRDGIFEIDMSCSNTNDSSMYANSNKRAKINLDSSLLWHCRLGQISKKRIEKLQHDGLLNSIDIESLGKCVSCMSEKMARKPYSHQLKRAKDLLGQIHTDSLWLCLPAENIHGVFETFKVFQKEVENQLGKTIKSLCFDRGGEYMSQEFLDHLKEHGIIAHRTPPYTPQQNGVSERRNRTLLDMVRSMMSQTTLPKSFWDYALKTAAHLKESRSVEDLELIQEEDNNPFLDTSLDHEEDDQEINEPQSDINPIRKSSRTHHAPDHMCLYIDDEEHELGDFGEPANYKAALLDPKSEKWLDAINVEMQSIKENDVWVLVELPPNARTVGSKWIFKKKTDIDGAIYVFKARRVAKGFTQTYGVDYEETFSHVAYIRAIRILIAIDAYYDHEIWKIYFKTAFLNGHLSKEVYMKQPKGFMNPKYANHCLHEKILKRYYMDNSKRETIPMQEKLKLSKSQGVSTPAEKQRMQNVSYASAIGSIMYDMRCTRPDVALTQNITSRFQQNLDKEHWIAVKNILKYLRNTKDMFLVYGGNMKRELRVSCYTDARYLTDADDLKSQTGYVAIAIAKDDGVTKGARHFRAKVYYLCETIKLGDVKIEKVDTYDNLADPFTKALAFPKHSELTRNIEMLPASNFM
nr:retrotransposon protein, putative, Ty1-copia subclass [Tanacetum cinerariifolium]